MMSFFARNQKYVQAFKDGDWNFLDLQEHQSLQNPNIKAIHYTRMDQQPHLPYAVPRLNEQGKRHWYDRPTRPNDFPGLQKLFDDELHAAIAAGYAVENYEWPNPFKYHIRGKG
jgi:hypothetical protein